DLDQKYASRGFDGVSNARLPEYGRSKYTLLNLVMQYDAGPLSITNSVGFLDQDKSYRYDLGPSFIPFLPPGMITAVGGGGSKPARIFTEEFRVASNGDQPFSWTAGVYFRHATETDEYLAESIPVDIPDL